MSIDIPLAATAPRIFGSRCCAALETQIGTADAEALSDTLQLLAHPVRLQILNILAQHAGRVCVCDLEAALPVKQATVSHHLRLLRAGGLIDCERHGQWAYYFVQTAALTGVLRQTLALFTAEVPAAAAGADHGA
jgi:ArsR family transcriptional regulator, arsenate/arsenite/antimonite-responsive transcriptional repressor